MANLPKTNSSPEISDAESEVANPSSPPSNHLQSHRHLRVNNVNSSFNTTIPPPPPQSYLKSLNRKRAPSKWDDAEKWLICCDNSSLSCIHKLSLPLARSNLHNLDLPHVRKGIYESTRDLVSKKDLSDRVHESSSVNTMSSLHFLDDNASNYNGSDHDHVSEVYHARHSHAMTMIENPTMKPTMKPSRNNDSCERSRQQHRILQNLERKCVSLCNVRSRSILEEIEPTLSRSIGADEQGSQHKDQHFRHGNFDIT